VPTPIGNHREPDLSFVVQTIQEVALTLHRGQLVILESTTYPGTTTEVVRPILESTGLKSGQDFFLAYSPEREDPGNALFQTSTIPKVVGGDGTVALTLATAFYASFVDRVVQVSSTATFFVRSTLRSSMNRGRRRRTEKGPTIVGQCLAFELAHYFVSGVLRPPFG
jgi:UDP-N-acetyl-D-glucosamine dehydrogenase